MITAIPLLACFALYEQIRERAGRSPLVSMALFDDRSFSAGLVVVLVFFSGIIGFFLAFTVFLQLGLGYDPLQSALTTLPSSVGLIVAAQLSAKVAQRLGRSMLAIGAFVMAAAEVALILTIHHFGSRLSLWDVWPVIFIFGMGMGLIPPSLADVIIAGVHKRHAGAASGVINTGMQVGNAAGVAIIGVILFSVIGSHAGSSAARVTPQMTRQLSAIRLEASERVPVVQQFHTCFVDTAHQEDPAAVPPSCRQRSQLPPAVERRVDAVLISAATAARKDNFAVAIQRALLYEVAVFLATTGLLFLLPRARRVENREAERRNAASRQAARSPA
jgi:MFS family permease